LYVRQEISKVQQCLLFSNLLHIEVLYFALLLNVPNVQVSDTTGDAIKVHSPAHAIFI